MARLNLNALHASKARLAARRAKIADRAARFKREYDYHHGIVEGIDREIEAIDAAMTALAPFQNAGVPLNPSRRGMPNAVLEASAIEGLRAHPDGITRSQLWEWLNRKGLPMPSEKSFAIWLSRNKAKIGAVYDGSAGKTDGVWKLAS